MEIFLQFSLPPPYTKLKLGKKFGYTRPTLFVGWEKELDLCELENAPPKQKCSKTFVHDMIVGKWSPPLPRECSRDRDAWHTADVLDKNVGLLETDGETKLATNVCKGADESL